jgi:hypothetical protein
MAKPLWQLMHDAQGRELAENPMADHSEVHGAMIRAVADWLETQQEVPVSSATASADYFAAMLREEANR